MHHLFYAVWIWFAEFVCVHEKYWPVNFFLVMSLLGFGIRVLVTSLRFGNCSPIFCSLKDCIWFLEFCTCLILFPSLYYNYTLYYYTVWLLSFPGYCRWKLISLILQPFLKMHFKYAFSSYKFSWFSCISHIFSGCCCCWFFLKKIYLAVLCLTCNMGYLVFWPGIEPRTPALGAQSLSHWTSREVPVSQIVMLHLHYHSFISAYFLISTVISSLAGY